MQIVAFTVIIHINSLEFAEKSLLWHCSGSVRPTGRCIVVRAKKDMPVLKERGEDGRNGLKNRMKKI